MDSTKPALRPVRVRVRVERKHYEDSRQGNCERCVLAKAIWDALPKDLNFRTVRVYPDRGDPDEPGRVRFWSPEGGTVSADLPPVACEYALSYDDGPSPEDLLADPQWVPQELEFDLALCKGDQGN